MSTALSIRGVSKSYRIYPGKRDRMKEVFSLGKSKLGYDFWALQDVNVEVEWGTTLGVLGRNGAGKSTLLQIASGILQPTRGTVEARGRLVALLQLGAGFNLEFSGRENVILNGLILGISRRDMMRKLEEIEAFADIGDFMDQPVKTYSSGMRARLGFAVAVSVDPDILVVDETLAVGDAIFKHMSLQKMRDLRDRGTTILFVSHSTSMVRDFCTEAILLHRGKLLASGETDEAIDRYHSLLASIEAARNGKALDLSETPNYEIDDDEGRLLKPEFKENPDLDRRAPGFRRGTGEARVTSVELLDDQQIQTYVVEPDSKVTVRVHLEYKEAVKRSSVVITLRNKAGIDVFSTTTSLQNIPLGRRKEGERAIVDFTFAVPLQPGAYSVSAGINHPGNRKSYMDWVDVAAAFQIDRTRSPGAIMGIVRLPTQIEIHNPDGQPAARSDQSA